MRSSPPSPPKKQFLPDEALYPSLLTIPPQAEMVVVVVDDDDNVVVYNGLGFSEYEELLARSEYSGTQTARQTPYN